MQITPETRLGVMNLKFWLQFLLFLIADVFSHKISSGEEISGKAVPCGGTKSETVRFEKNTFVTLNCNISWFLNDKNIFFC